MTVAAFTKTGSKSSTKPTLPKAVFGVDVKNTSLLAQIFEAERSNSRVNRASTLKRGEVRGGGRKPWRQKGTGRARAGSIRSPLWRGGGVTFGPDGRENYYKKINGSSRKTALKQALSLKAQAGEIALIDDFVIKDGKSKEAQNLISKLGLSSPLLIVTDKIDESTSRAVRNLSDCQLVSSSSLSTKLVVDSATLLMTRQAVAALSSRLEVKS